MATSINVRLSDELEKKLNDTVNEVKKNTPIGAEVNNSTIVRGALEDFFNKLEEDKKGIKNVKYDLSILDCKECKEAEEIINNMLNILKNENRSAAEKFIKKIMISIYLDINERHMETEFSK